MNYFQTCNTPEKLKVRWKELAKLHHPDLGGDVKIMQEINKQYGQELLKFRRSEFRKHATELMQGMYRQSEEVEPKESYWKKNNIDPYEHLNNKADFAEYHWRVMFRNLTRNWNV